MRNSSALRITASLLGLLACAPFSFATDIAKLPLKASILAKPNVIFGMDDSGSMDWEMVLDTEKGLAWWDGTSASDPVANKALHSSDGFRPMAYLFPLGTTTGGALYHYDSFHGQTAPPTTQFAWLRSARFNPIFYDSMVTYKPWSPAYFDGSLKTYSNASTSAAPAHPAVSDSPTLDLTTSWNSGNADFSTNGYMFYMQEGMVVPAGAYVLATTTTSGVCQGSTWRTLTTDVTVESDWSCWAAIPYYPATFWHAQACTVNGSTCISGPDGSTTIKRYEIKSSTTAYPSGRTYTQELQNFANWFTYHRKRKLMLAAAMGEVSENVSGLRMGVVPFASSASSVSVTMHDADAVAASSNRLAVAGQFYLNSMQPKGTPTHETIKHIASQFDGNSSIVQYACQRNSMFIMTDGFPNAESVSVPSYNSTQYGAGPPYQTTHTGSLADLALAYYSNRLRTDLAAGKVPREDPGRWNSDQNTDLHINTYALTLGVRGSLWPNTVDPFVTAPTWPTPVIKDPSLIDDQWHATINGRGRMYLATSPSETALAISAALRDILGQVSTQSNVAVRTVNLQRGDSTAYLGTYNPAGWAGDLVAHNIDPANGAIATAQTWSAADLLTARDWTTRVIATTGGGFTPGGVGSTVNPAATYGTNTEVVNYLRGERTHEGTKFRTRKSLIGAVINAAPALSRSDGVAYVASGEGMLHAIETEGADAGKELWAYVPGPALAGIGKTTQRGYSFRAVLDGLPVIGKSGASQKILVAGMGTSGRQFFALDITSPRGLNETQLASKHLWDFPTAGDTATQAKVGQTLGRPVIVKTKNDGYVVLVTSGYNSTADGKGRMWMLSASTGAVIHEFEVAAGTLAAESGLAQVTAFSESTGVVKYVYGGDLLGNVWRFDLDAKTAPNKIAVLKGPAGDLQPVTAAPELMYSQGKRIVLVGTGRLLGITDFGDSHVQSIYAISDGSTLSSARASLVQQTYTRATNTASTNPVDWATDRGWYLDLPAGEQINTRPNIAYGGLAFVSNINGATDCSASSYLYVVDVLTGTKYDRATFVSVLLSNTANSSGVTALVTSAQKVVGSGQDADGKVWQHEISAGASIAPRKNSWQEIRR